jgi:hypothetical protein
MLLVELLQQRSGNGNQGVSTRHCGELAAFDEGRAAEVVACDGHNLNRSLSLAPAEPATSIHRHRFA